MIHSPGDERLKYIIYEDLVLEFMEARVSELLDQGA